MPSPEKVESDADVEFDIPDGMPGSVKRRVETLDVGEIPVVKRNRGRPRGSTNKSSPRTTPTEIERMVADGLALGYGVVFASLAIHAFNNPKYRMTKDEAHSAAKATAYVLFQYKAIRDLAVKANMNSNAAILLKGFYPYLQRVVLREVLDYVISGLFVSGRKQSGTGKPGESKIITGNFGTPEPTRNDTVGTNGTNPTEPIVPTFGGNTDWRDV